MKKKHTTPENNPQQTFKTVRLRGLWKRILAMGLTVAMIGSTPGFGSLQASAETNETVQTVVSYEEDTEIEPTEAQIAEQYDSDPAAVQNSTEAVQGSTEADQESTEAVQGSTEADQESTEELQESTEGLQESTEELQESTEADQESTEEGQGSTEADQESTEEGQDSTGEDQENAVVRMEITKTDGTSESCYYATWNEAMLAMSGNGDKLNEFQTWDSIKLVLLKDTTVNDNVERWSTDLIWKSATICSENGTHTLTGSGSNVVLDAPYVGITLENIKIENGCMELNDLNLTLEKGVEVSAAPGVGCSVITMTNGVLTLNNASVVSTAELAYAVDIYNSEMRLNGINAKVSSAYIADAGGKPVTTVIDAFSASNGGIPVFYAENSASILDLYFTGTQTDFDTALADYSGQVKLWYQITLGKGATLAEGKNNDTVTSFEDQLYGLYRKNEEKDKSLIYFGDGVCNWTSYAQGGTYIAFNDYFVMPASSVRVSGHSWNDMGKCTDCSKISLEEAYQNGYLTIQGLEGRTYDSYPQILSQIAYDGTELTKPQYDSYQNVGSVGLGGDTPLNSDAEYTVVYQNNVKPYPYKQGEDGFDASKAPSVTITGYGSRYVGSLTVYFTIGEGEMRLEDFEVCGDTGEIVYDGKEHPAWRRTSVYFKVDSGDRGQFTQLEEDEEYIPACDRTASYEWFSSYEDIWENPIQVEYSTDDMASWNVARAFGREGDFETPYAVTDAGEYPFYIRVTEKNCGKQLLSGQLTAKITPRDLGASTITLDASEAVTAYYTGKPVIPTAYDEKITDSGLSDEIYTLQKGKDFTVSAKDNTDVTTDDKQATLVFTGTGNYKGELTADFAIQYAFTLAQTTASKDNWFGDENCAYYDGVKMYYDGVKVFFQESNTSSLFFKRYTVYRASKADDVDLDETVEIYPSLEAAVEGTDPGYVFKEEGVHTATLYGRDPKTGYISAPVEVTLKIDRTAPTWKDEEGYGIQVKEDRWAKLFDSVGFSYFYNDSELTARIKAVDESSSGNEVSGVRVTYCYIQKVSDEDAASGEVKIKTKEELDQISSGARNIYDGFTAVGGLIGHGTVTKEWLGNDGNYIIYAYAEDYAGNKSDYICSEGIVNDTVSPTLTLTEPDQESGTLTDAKGTYQISASEDATLLYFYVHEGEFDDTAAYEAFVAEVKKYIAAHTDAATGKYPPYAVKENGKWKPGFTTNGEEASVTDSATRPMYRMQVTKGDNNELTITDLRPDRACAVWMAAIDRAGNISLLPQTNFTTTKRMAEIKTLPEVGGVYGDTLAQLKVTKEGVAVFGDEEITGTWAVTDTGSTPLEAGENVLCQVTFTPDAQLYGDDYEPTVLNVTPTIAKSPLTIWVEDMFKTYGEDLPEISFEIPEDEGNSLIGNDTVETIRETLELVMDDAARTPEASAGEWPFEVRSTSTNYDVTVKYRSSPLTTTQKEKGCLYINKAEGKIIKDDDFMDVQDVQYIYDGNPLIISLGVKPNHTETTLRYVVSDAKKANGDPIAQEDIEDKLLSISPEDGTVTLKGAGSAKITITLPPSANYAAGAEQYTVQVNIAKADVTIPESTVYSVYTLENAYTYDMVAENDLDSERFGAILYGDGSGDNSEAVSGMGITINGTQVSDEEAEEQIFAALPYCPEDSDEIRYTIKSLESFASKSAIVTIPAESENCTINNGKGITLRIEIADTQPATPETEVKVAGELTYGEPLSALAFEDTVFVGAGDRLPVEGTLAWREPDLVPDAGTVDAAWVFTPVSKAYVGTESTVSITVNQAVPQVKAVPTVAERIYSPTTALADADLTGGEVIGVDGKTLAGAWSWQTTGIIPEVGNTGYTAVFTPEDTTNYETVTKTVTVDVAQAEPEIGTVSAEALNNTLDVTKVKLSRTDTAIAGALELKEDASLSYGTHDYTYQFTPESGNYKAIEGTVSITVNDTIAPTASYRIDTNAWTQLKDTIILGTYSKDSKKVEIAYSDKAADGETDGSGLAKQQYYIAHKEIESPETAITDEMWQDYTEAISLDAAGTYFIYVRAVDQAGNVMVGNSEGIVIYEESTISPESAAYIYKENRDCVFEVTYNGNTLKKLMDDDGSILTAEDYTLDEAGKLTLKAAYLDTLTPGTYIYWMYMYPQGEEASLSALEYTFTVTVKQAELTVTGAAAKDRPYDKASDQIDITAVTLSGVRADDDVSVSTEGLQGTVSSVNAGSYTEVTLPELTLTGAAAANYRLVQPEGAVTLTDGVTISRLDTQLTVGTEEYNKVYGDASFTLDVTKSEAESEIGYTVTSGTDVISVEDGIVMIRKAGTATIQLSLAESQNYNAAEDKTVTVNVAKQTGYTVDTINRSYLNVRDNAESIDLASLLPSDCGAVVYGSPVIAGDVTYSVEPVVEDGTLAYTVKEGTAGDEGTIQITVVTDNYADITITVSAKLIPQIPVTVKDGTEVTLKNAVITYGEALSEMEFNDAVFTDSDGNEVKGTLAWKNPDMKPDAGTVSAAWIFTPDQKEYAVLEDETAITVQKAVPQIKAVPAVAERTYSPTTVLADADLTGGEVTGVDGSTLAGTWSWQTADIIPVVDNAGYTAVFTPEDTTNYETVTETVTVNVAQAEPVIGTVLAEELNDTLDVTKVKLSRTDEMLAGALELKADTSLSYGTHDYTYRFTPEDGNYKVIEGNVSITVNDTIAPTASYKIGTDEWKKFVNTITFGMFCKDYKTVEIAYSDKAADGETDGSGIAKQQYYIADQEIEDAETVITDEMWKDYTGAISLDAAGTYFIYVMAVDQAGNGMIENSEGIVIYEESAVNPENTEYIYKENRDCVFETAYNGNTFNRLTDEAGNSLTVEAYTLDEAGRLTLKAAYLDTLTPGAYTYKLYLNPQGVETELVTLAYTFTVTVKQAELTVTGAAAKDRPYDKTSDQVDITAVTLSGVRDGDEVSVSTEGLQGTLSSVNAGSYTEVTLPELTLTGAAAANYRLVQPEGAVTLAGEVTISRLDAQLTVGTEEYNKVYGDAAFTLDVTKGEAESEIGYTVTSGTDVIDVEDGTVTIKNAGTATVKVSLPESTNYNAAEDKTITVNVAKQTGYTVDTINRSYLNVRDNAESIDLAALLPADCGAAVYGSPVMSGDVAYSVEPSVEAGTLAYTVKEGTVGNEGTIQITVVTDNYADITITVSVKLVDRIPVTVKAGTEVTLKNAVITYGEALSKMVFHDAEFTGEDGKAVTGTLTWKNPDEKPEAGTVSAAWIFTPDKEEYAALENEIAITVKKADPQIKAVPTVAERTYSPVTALADTDLTGGNVTGVDGNTLAGAWSWQTADIVPEVGNTGYTAVFTPEDAKNYEAVTATIAVNVTKAVPAVAEKPEASDITYGSSLKESVLTGGSMLAAASSKTGVAGSFAWKDESIRPAVSDSGKTEYTVVFTPEDTVNYEKTEFTVTLTVKKSADTPNLPENTINVPYSVTKVSEVTLPENWAWQDADKDTVLTAGKAVSVTAVYCGADAGNYEVESVVIAVTRLACEHKSTELKNAKAATYTQTGYTGDTCCKECGAVIKKGAVIPMLQKEEPAPLKKGTKFTAADGAVYKVLSASKAAPTVTYYAAKKNAKGAVTVPATVVKNGITYKVVAIAGRAFANRKNLRSVTIGKNVASIGKKAFYNCKKLKKVTIKTTKLTRKKIGASAFKNTAKKITFKLPAKKYKTYKKILKKKGVSKKAVYRK